MRGNVAEKLKQVMRAFPQGVTIVTTKVAGRPFGVTISAFSSISLNPPLVMISVAKETKAHGNLLKAESFAVNILASNQSEISERFAGRLGGKADDFRDLALMEGSNRCPVLKTCLGYLECTREALHDAGDHTIIIGKITHGSLRRNAPPLVYYDQHYASVGK